MIINNKDDNDNSIRDKLQNNYVVHMNKSYYNF